MRRAVGEDAGPFAAPLALNVVPWSGELREGGWSSHELAVRAQTRRVLHLDALPVAVTCVQVPVLTGHSLSVRARFEAEVEASHAREILEAAPGVVVVDDPAAGSSRLRWTRPGRIRHGWGGCGPRSTIRTPWSSSCAPTISATGPP